MKNMPCTQKSLIFGSHQATIGSFGGHKLIRFLILLVSCLILDGSLSSIKAVEAVTLKSPDGQVDMAIETGEHLTYTVTFYGETVVTPSVLGISVNGQDLGQNTVLTDKAPVQTVKENYLTRGVHTNALNFYHSATLPLTGGADKTAWQLEVRVYDDGVAYRYVVPGSGVRHIDGESSEWQLPMGTTIWHQSDANRSYEARFEEDLVGQMGLNQKIMAPAALKFPGQMGYGLMTEANLINYSDMALASSGSNGFKALFHDNPSGWDQTGEIVSPWHVTLLAKDLNTMVNSDLIKNLCPAPAPELANADWIKPGRSIWHWLTGGSPKLEEQHAWIDGTKAMGYEYYLIDDGWRRWNGGGTNAWQAMADVVNYAKSQNVKIWVWVGASYVFKPEDREAYFQRAQDLGIVGVKVDFPKPPSAEWVQWYEDTLRDGAKHHLISTVP